jgi:hypothetical protein
VSNHPLLVSLFSCKRCTNLEPVRICDWGLRSRFDEVFKQVDYLIIRLLDIVSSDSGIQSERHIAKLMAISVIGQKRVKVEVIEDIVVTDTCKVEIEIDL